MARRKIPYNKRATTYEEQMAILRRHGVVISDEAKAREYLADIGYYRLGFYLYPFEKTYPRLDSGRSPNVIQGTRIEDAVALYYFDLDLRNILHKYLSRIEVAIRLALDNIVVTKLFSEYCNATLSVVHELHTALFQCSSQLFTLGLYKVTVFYSIRNAAER